MNFKFTGLVLVALGILATGCSKDQFSEADAIAAQKELLDLKYQHEMDLEALKQKGASALQQLINTAALEQLRFNDSLSRASAIAAAKQDYSVAVVDVVTNAPIADADVIVSSEGKVFSAKSNAQGIAMFNSLYLFPTSTFLITKSGYAATQIMRKDVTLGTAKLWNTAELSNEISGTLYIDTDLTTPAPEKVGANVLITASAKIPNGYNSTYSVSFPAYSLADGTYSMKLPAAPTGYSLTFGQVEADQKMYVVATSDDSTKTPPTKLPYLTTIKTYFNVNSFNAAVPSILTPIYIRFPKDKVGKEFYLPINYYSNNIYLSPVAGGFQAERLIISNVNYYDNGMYVDFSQYIYEPNTKLDLDVIDISGKIVKNSPLLSATTNSYGRIVNVYPPEGGNSYVQLRRDASGALVPNAKGLFTRATLYDSYQNLYTLNFQTNLNVANNLTINTTYLLPNKGDRKIVNFYYGSGDSRVKDVY